MPNEIIEGEVIHDESGPSQALAIRPSPALEMLMPVMDLKLAKSRLKEFQTFIAEYLVEGIDQDYGVIPGTTKKTLLQPGADKLNEIYGLVPRFIITAKVEDYPKGLFDYSIRCDLMRGSHVAGSGMGSCSSFESRYRYRNAERKCPSCSGQFIIKGKEEYGGGWLCWKKKGGCGATFKDQDPAITEQETGKVENDNLVDVKNTVLKMSLKRAKVGATIAATRSSGIFTQDMEDEIVPESTPPAKTPSNQTAAPEGPRPPTEDQPKRSTKKGAATKASPPPPTPNPEPVQAGPTAGSAAGSAGTAPAPQPPGYRKVNAGEVRRFWAIAREKGWPEDKIKLLLLEAKVPEGSSGNITTSSDRGQGQYGSLIERLSKGAPK